jgi:hypothetical protein
MQQRRTEWHRGSRSDGAAAPNRVPLPAHAERSPNRPPPFPHEPVPMACAAILLAASATVATAGLAPEFATAPPSPLRALQETGSTEDSCQGLVDSANTYGAAGGQTSRTLLRSVMAACSGADGAIDTAHCPTDCANGFVSFWEACSSTVMADAKNRDTEGLPSFYDTCRAVQLEQTGFAHRGECSDDNYDVRKAEMTSVCCRDANACHDGDNSGLPHDCSLECAVIFSEFYEDCVHEIGEETTRDGARDYDHLYRTCIDEAPVAQMLDLLADLTEDGCLINEGGAQSSTPHIESGQVWIGHYLCGQGDTNLQIEITEVDADGMVQAVFDFDHNEDPTNECSGRYTVSGTLQGDGGLVLEPEQAGSGTVGWLENPCGYVSVGLDGTVALQSSGEMTYSGTIENPACGAFMVTMPSSGNSMGHLECPQSDAGWMLGPTMCYVKHEVAMELEEAIEFCHGLDPRAVVAKVPTLDDLRFLTAQIPDDTPYLLGATCPSTDKVFCDFLDGTPVTITPSGYCEVRLNPAERHAGCGEPDDIQDNVQLGVNKNGLFDGSMHARQFWCSVPPLPASASQSCANDLSGTWEGDWVQGNTGGGTQDISADQYITTITQTLATFVEEFHVQHEQMECSDATGENDQSVQYKNGLDQYVSMSDCERACQVEDECNGMIEFGLHVCTRTTTDPMTGLTSCDGMDEGRCIAEDRCTCYLVTGTCSSPIPHDHYNILRMERTAASASPFTATCEHHDRCNWSPATGHVSEDLAMVTMETGFQLQGVLSEDGMEIAWSNGAFWTRLSECGSFGHLSLPLEIPGGFQVGSQLLCTGVWASDIAGADFNGPEVFALNFRDGNGDIALHINPRDCEEAHPGCNAGEHVVVRNSYLDGSWGTEERGGELPLRHDVMFQLRITAGRDDFRITIEGDGSRGEFGGQGSFGMIHEGMECSTGGNADQSLQYRAGIQEYVTFDQCEQGCLATPACAATGMIEYGLMPGRCTGPNACKCYLVTGTCDAPVAHESYSVFQLGAPQDTTTRYTYSYRVPVESIVRVDGGGHSIQYCDLNQVPDVPLFRKDFQGKEWTLVRRVKPGPSWHPATDELLGTDEYGTYCGERGAADHCDTSAATFSIPFGDHGRSSMVWDQIMFAAGDMSMFVILDKAEMDACTEGTNDGQWFPQVAQGSGHPEPYSVTQYCRQGAEEDPWLSVDQHPTNVVYGEGSFNVPAWCDSRGQLAPDLTAHPEVSEIGTINGVTLYKVPMRPGPMTNSNIEKACGRLGLLTPCYVVGDDQTGEQWSNGNCEAIPGAPPVGACPYGESCPYLPETMATQIFGCRDGVGACQGGNGSPGNDGQMEGLFTVIYNHMDDRPCAIIDGGYCHEAEPVYQSTAERPLYGVCSFAVGVGSCPAHCWTGTAGDGNCPNTCEHCNDDAIMGHGGANVWVHEVAAPGGGHRRLEKNETAPTATAPAPKAEKAEVDAEETFGRQLQTGGFGSLGGVRSSCKALAALSAH